VSDNCTDHNGDDTCTNDLQREFDKFYDMALNRFNKFYPEHTVSVTSRDPDYMTRPSKLNYAGETD